MADSLRSRLLRWFTAILGLVIAGYGGAVCWLFWSSLVGEVDGQLRVQSAIVAAAVRPVGPGLYDVELPSGAAAGFEDTGEGQAYYAIWDAAGRPLDVSSPLVDLTAVPPVGLSTRAGRRELVVAGPGESRVLVGQDLAAVRGQVLALVWLLAGAGMAAIVFSLAGGSFLAGRAFAPVKRIALTAGEMLQGRLSARIAVEQTESELGQLALALNAAFDRLQHALDKERRFTADASHELRTPLATLTAELDWALGRERTAEEYRRSLEICQTATARMTSLTERLLTLARADAGQIHAMAPVRLDDVVEDVVRVLRPLAGQRNISIHVQPGRATVLGDHDGLSELVSNLVANAVQYNRDGGRVDIALDDDRAAGIARLRVTDTGVGIRAEEMPRVFDRFYRAESARTRRAGGAGLGLAVAKSIAEAHRGAITCRSEPDKATVFEVQLPTTEPLGAAG